MNGRIFTDPTKRLRTEPIPPRCRPSPTISGACQRFGLSTAFRQHRPPV
jgi:hypothetical protein